MNEKSKTYSETVYKEYRKHHKHGFFAVIFITLGVLLLLSNFGILPANIWSDLWKLWPILLITWGMQMIIGKSQAANIVITIIWLLIATIIVILLLGTNNNNVDSWLNTYFPGLFHFSPRDSMPFYRYHMYNPQ